MGTRDASQPVSPERPTSSPRGQVREEAILQATIELLAQEGYDRVSIDAVAARAHASKATIYRRWPGKAELVAAALKRHGDGHQPIALPDTGCLRDDLLALLRALRETMVNQDAALILGLMTAMRRDAEFDRIVRDEIVDDKRNLFGAVIDRALSRGEIPMTANHGTLAEVSSAMLFSRLLVVRGQLDDPFVYHLVDDVLLPLLDQQLRLGSVPAECETR